MSTFVDIKAGKPVILEYIQSNKTKAGVMNFCCCDCGLVHNIVFIPLKTRLKVYFYRDNRRTANHRRSKVFITKAEKWTK